MSWRVAQSLKAFQRQLEAACPDRSIASDGYIGDDDHQNRSSDHNPWVQDGNKGVVTAGDYTHDPANGADMNEWVAALIHSRDPRIKYVIWRRQIWRGYAKPGRPAWTPQAYGGPNPHTKHAHVSVDPEKRLYDDTSPWAVPADKEDEMIPQQQMDEIKAHIDSRIDRAVDSLKTWVDQRAAHHIGARDRHFTELVAHARAEATMHPEGEVDWDEIRKIVAEELDKERLELAGRMGDSA